MWVWDVSGNVVWMTERGRSLFGLEPDARLDFAATFDRVHPEDRTAREDAITRALQTRGEYEMEYRVRPADGTARWIYGRGRCVGPDDGTAQSFSACRWMSRLANRPRRQPRNSGRNWSTSRAWPRSASSTTTLTHELGQPLAAILTHCYVGMRCSTHPSPISGRCAARLATSARSPSAATKSFSGLRAMLRARQHGGALDRRRSEQVRSASSSASCVATRTCTKLRSTSTCRPTPPGQG